MLVHIYTFVILLFGVTYICIYICGESRARDKIITVSTHTHTVAEAIIDSTNRENNNF